MNDHEYDLQVVEKIQETNDTQTLILKPRSGSLRYQAGQFLTFLFDGLAQEQVRRSYSFSSSPSADNYLAVTVKRKANGLVSRYLQDKVQQKDTLRALPPSGQFVLPIPENTPEQLIFISGGSGITPIFSLVKEALLERPASSVYLLYASSNEHQIIFREELIQWARQYPDRFFCRHLLSMPLTPIAALKELIQPHRIWWGRLSNHLVEQFVRSITGGPTGNALFYICGPEGLMLKSSSQLRFMGFTDDQIRQEQFIIRAPLRPVDMDFPHCRVEWTTPGGKAYFEVPPGKTILEAAEAAGIYIPYNCRSGSCSMCSATCTKGNIRMYSQDGIFDSNASKGIVFTCVGYPLEDELHLEVSDA